MRTTQLQQDGRQRRHVVVLLALVCVLIASGFWSLVERPDPRTVRMESLAGILTVEIADTAASRSAGLSKRDELHVDGLLLQWNAPGRHPVWMADMRFSLDLVWLDAGRRVLAVLPNVPPCRTAPCPLYEPKDTDQSIAVLELRAGLATRHEMAAGVTLRFVDNESAR